MITQPDLQEGKYDWLDPEMTLKPVGSTSKIHMGEEAGNAPNLIFTSLRAADYVPSSF